LIPRSSSEDIIERHIQLLYTHTNKGFAAFKAAEFADVPNEDAGCHPEVFKADLESLLRGILPDEEAEGVETLRR
jgi:hypothetical protein